MFENLDWKLIASILAPILSIIATVPYLKDIFAKKTTPHLYTWLIWAISQGTAAVALLYGGGKLGSIGLLIGTILSLIIFVLSFKYGTKNITRSDTITLIIALLAIIVWWQLNNPLLAVLMVTAIDLLGYIPTFRKLYVEPYSETISSWVIWIITPSLTLFSNAQYNWLTVTYLAAAVVINITVVATIIIRRRVMTMQIT